MTTCSGKPTICRTYSVPQSQSVYVGSHLEDRHLDEQFWVEVVDPEGDHGWVRVTKATFSEAQVGVHVKEAS